MRVLSCGIRSKEHVSSTPPSREGPCSEVQLALTTLRILATWSVHVRDVVLFRRFKYSDLYLWEHRKRQKTGESRTEALPLFASETPL